MCKFLKGNQADKAIFLVCLIISISLAIGGFFVPPMGIIDGSVLTAIGLLLGFATLAVAAQAIKDGRVAKFSKGDLEISINSEQDLDNNNN